MLFQSINKIKRSSIITSLLLIALGVVMIICPGSYTMSLISGMGYAVIDIGPATTPTTEIFSGGITSGTCVFVTTNPFTVVS